MEHVQLGGEVFQRSNLRDKWNAALVQVLTLSLIHRATELEQRLLSVPEQRLLSVPELSLHLADSYLTCCLYLQDMLQYKKHHHGKVTQSHYCTVLNLK